MAVYQRGKNWYIDFTFHRQIIPGQIIPVGFVVKNKAEKGESKCGVI